MVLFPPSKGGGEDVAHDYKGKVVTIHLLVDGNGMPLAESTKAANKSERDEVLVLLGGAQINTKKGRPKSCYRAVQFDTLRKRRRRL